MSVKTGEQDTLITTSDQFATAIFALSRQINKEKVCENNLLCAGNKVFVTYQTQGGLTPNLPLLSVMYSILVFSIAAN